MRRLTLNMALGSLLVAAMSLTSTEATAQSRGERNGRGRVESSQRSSASRSQSTRSSESRMERGTSRSGSNATTINRSEVRSNRTEASNWPKTNRNNATVNTDRDNRRDQSASQSRRNGIGRTFDSRKENANNNNGDGNHGGNNNGGYRPGGNNHGDGNHNGNNNGGYRPGGNHNGGNHNDGGYRPGGNHGGNNNGGYRPGGNNHGGNHNDGGYRPGNNGNHNGNHNHGGYKPGPGNFHPGVNRPHDHHGMIVHRPHSWVTPVAPPIRHFRPHHHHIIRPVIPVGYHPWHRAPVIRGILGLTFGTAYYASLDYLYDRGYEIDGYYDGIVYLRNVIEMRVTWPDVMLNYGSLNALNSAEFHYSTSFDDLGRFNFVHRELCNRYGSPMSYDESRSGIQAVWYGGNATGYVTLEYFYQNGRYYTTLSYSH